MNNNHKYVLDASAFVNILPLISVEQLEKHPQIKFFITQLTPFEIGNSLWKLYTRGKIEIDDAITLMELVKELIESHAIRVAQITKFTDIMKIALKRKITYYDATYLYLAKKMNAVLVTDDNGMKTNAEIESIMTLNSTELRARHSTIFKL